MTDHTLKCIESIANIVAICITGSTDYHDIALRLKSKNNLQASDTKRQRQQMYSFRF